MAVPAHDERDYEFAKTFDLEILPVIEGGNIEEAAYTEDGPHINSEFLNGMNKAEAIAKMNEWLEENSCGKKRSAIVYVTGYSHVNVTGGTNSDHSLGRWYSHSFTRRRAAITFA